MMQSITDFCLLHRHCVRHRSHVLTASLISRLKCTYQEAHVLEAETELKQTSNWLKWKSDEYEPTFFSQLLSGRWFSFFNCCDCFNPALSNVAHHCSNVALLWVCAGDRCLRKGHCHSLWLLWVVIAVTTVCREWKVPQNFIPWNSHFLTQVTVFPGEEGIEGEDDMDNER